MAMALQQCHTFIISYRNENLCTEKAIRQMLLIDDLFNVILFMPSGEKIRANKFILSMYSPTFLDLFTQMQPHEKAFMTFNGYSYNTIAGIIELLHTGRVEVTGKEVNDMKVAIDYFKISDIKINPPPMILQQKTMVAERNVVKKNFGLPQTRPVPMIPSSIEMYPVSSATLVGQIGHKSDANVQHVSNASQNNTNPIQRQLQGNKENINTENGNIIFEFIDNATATGTNENAIELGSDANDILIEFIENGGKTTDYSEIDLDIDRMVFNYIESIDNTNEHPHPEITMDIGEINEANEHNDEILKVVPNDHVLVKLYKPKSCGACSKYRGNANRNSTRYRCSGCLYKGMCRTCFGKAERHQ